MRCVPRWMPGHETSFPTNYHTIDRQSASGVVGGQLLRGEQGFATNSSTTSRPSPSGDLRGLDTRTLRKRRSIQEQHRCERAFCGSTCRRRGAGAEVFVELRPAPYLGLFCTVFTHSFFYTSSLHLPSCVQELLLGGVAVRAVEGQQRRPPLRRERGAGAWRRQQLQHGGRRSAGESPSRGGFIGGVFFRRRQRGGGGGPSPGPSRAPPTPMSQNQGAPLCALL